ELFRQISGRSGKISRDDSEAPGPDRRADGRHDESRAFHRGKRDESLLYVPGKLSAPGGWKPESSGAWQVAQRRSFGTGEKIRGTAVERREDRKLLLQRKRTGNTELLLRGEYRTDAAEHFFAGRIPD